MVYKYYQKVFMKHFVYRLELLEPWDNRKYYVGKHSGEIEDVGVTYFSSGKLKDYYKSNINQVRVKILYIGKDSMDAIRYESKVHMRLDVRANPKFFNEQNQGLASRDDRTGLVTADNLETNERMTISVKEFRENPHLYKSVQCDKVTCIDIETNNFKNVSKEEFDSNDNLKGVNHGKIHTRLKSTNEKITVTKEEYHKNKCLYIRPNDNISMKLKSTGEFVSIPKEEYKRNKDLYVGVNKGNIEERHPCGICDKEIGTSNLARHRKSHSNRNVWVTDNENQNTIQVNELEYYTKLKDTHYMVKGKGHYRVGYTDGAETTIKKIAGVIRRKNKIKD